MTTLKIKSNRWVRWGIIAAVCYLLASAGVNGVIDPRWYIESDAGTEAKIRREEGWMIIDVPESFSREGYLNLKVKDMDYFRTDLNVLYNCGIEDPDSAEGSINICRGINSFPVPDRKEGVRNLAFSEQELYRLGIVLESARWSADRQVDRAKMLEIAASFLCMAAFYRFCTWIRRRYAK